MNNDLLHPSVERQKHINRRNIAIHGENILFILPAFLFFAFVVLIPFFQGVPYSFTNWKSIMSASRRFVGLKNYTVLLSNAYFLTAWKNTFVFTLLYIIITNVIALILAVRVQKMTRFNQFARTTILASFCVSAGAGAIMWSYVFTDLYSVVFRAISPLGLSSTVVYGMVVIAVWRDVGYCMLIYIAALQAIPQDYFEAALIDGSGRMHTFFKITLPLIVPAFTSNITLLLAWGLKLFDLPMSIAQNLEGAQMVSMYVYNYIFAYSKAGLGQAAAVLIVIVLVSLTAVVTGIFRRMEVEA